MYPARFEYSAPTHIDEAVEALQTLEGAKVLAGGQSLIPLMKLRLVTPSHLVDLRRVPSLGHVVEEGDTLRIGAMVTEAAIEGSVVVRELCPILVDASSVIADPIVRSLATVGGNLAHGDPANDHPAVMVALGARLVARGSRDDREIPAEDFFSDLFTTALSEEEILTEIRIPIDRGRSGTAYEKMERQVGDYAVAGAAVKLEVDGEDRIVDARIAFTNVGPTPQRAREGEALLTGEFVHGDVFSEAAQVSVGRLQPWSDLRGSEDYKRRVAAALAHRALGRAYERARQVV